MDAYFAAESLPLLVSSSGLLSPSSSSSAQQATTKHLPFPSAFSDCQVQAFSSSTHLNRKQLLRPASDCHASSSSSSSSASSSSTTRNVERKHLPRAFTEYQTQGFSYLSSPQPSRRMHVPRTFLNLHGCFGFMLTEQQQLPSFSVKTRASIGRFSGAVHGSSSRKGRPRKRSDLVHEGDNQELENLHQGEEIVGEPISQEGEEIVVEPISEDIDSHMFCDDVPYDKDSDCEVYSEDAPWVDKNHSLSSSDIYDSVHGDSWHTDPYFQELESSDNEIARKGQISDGSSLDSKNDTSIPHEKNLMQISDVGSSQNQEYLTAVQGGNGGVIAYESTDISESRSFSPETATEDSFSPSEDPQKSGEETFSSTSVNESTGHDIGKDQQCSLDVVKSLSQMHESTKDMVREVKGGDRPSASSGSLQNIEGTYLESRQCSGNSEVDESDLGFTETNVTGSVGGLNTSNVGGSAHNAEIVEESGEIIAVADAQTLPVAEQVGLVVEQVADFLADSIKEQVGNVVEQVENLPGQVSQVAEQVILKVVDQLPDPVVEQASQVADQVTQVADQVTQTAEQIVEQVTSQVVEPITSTASQIVNFLSSDEDDVESDDEFEAFVSLDIPEFKGRQGLTNFTILQEEKGILSVIYDIYIFMLKRSSFEFMLGMLAAPILLSMIFTILYLPEFSGLALDETIREALQNSEVSGRGAIPGLQLSWGTVFQVFMFSVSLATGLQPELAPMSPYTLVVANLNALFAQLIFVFLSGAVFARLSQPSQPVKCSTVAIICPPPSNRRLRKEACHKALLTRYVLVGPQPCELVDVKVDLTYNYNTVTRSGTYFRTSQSLKLMYRGVAQVRPEIAFLTNGMLVRHIIDETSPLYQRTQGMLEKEDAVFSLSVVGLERSSMQSVFHVQHYCVYDKDLVWDAEFVDMILISKKNRRVVDHSLLSKWRPVSVR